MVNILSVHNKIKKSYSKNIPEFFALKNKLYPEFVFDQNPKTLKDEIPVFTLHSVEPERFEDQLRFLHSNGYQTLIADEFYECLIGSKPIPERAVVLAFDDGWKSLRTVAYSLLKKYGLRAVCFIIPGLICKDDGSNSDQLCNWHEIKEMHESGVVDFQSHSMYHNLVFVSPTVEDFIHPSFECFAKNLNVSLFRVAGRENASRRAQSGTPIYRYAPKFSGKQRYFDDEKIRNLCIEYVAFKGGERFFRNYNWRKQLMRIIEDHRRKEGDCGYYQSAEDLREELYNDLAGSKILIEKKLPGKKVNHFCYPWWEGSDLAVEISKKVGYLTNFWGILPERRTNRRGDNPYRIVRLLSDDYLFRLPGRGRKKLLNILEERFSRYYRGFVNKLVQSD